MSSKRLLVWLKPNYLGDAVMATPLIDGLIATGSLPDVLAGGAVQQVLADRADDVQFVAAENLSHPLKLLKQARTMRGRYDTVLLVNRSFRSALAARFAGIPKRVGHSTEGRGWLLTSSLPYPPTRFEADCYLDLARAAGYDLAASRPHLQVTSEETEEGKKLLAGAVVGVQPGARYATKQVPIPVLAEVVKDIQAKGHTVAMFGGREEGPFGEQLRRLVGPQLLDLIGKTNLRQSIAALANLRLMIGSDTGVMHLAAASGCPTITVFGPNPIEKWGHAYSPHHPIRAPGGEISQITAQEILIKVSNVSL